MADWTPTQAEYIGMRSTPEIKTRLVQLIREMKVRPMGKDPKLRELTQWVIDELPGIAPNDPRTKTALLLAEAGLARSYI